MRLIGKVAAIAVMTLATILATNGYGQQAHAAVAAVFSHEAVSSCPKGTPAGSVCQTIPANCPTDQYCPTIVAQPTTNLASPQAVYLTLDNFFETTDSIYIQYCQDTQPLSKKPPLCVAQSDGELTNPQVVVKPFPATGSVSYAFQVLYIAKGSTPFGGVVPGTKTTGSFLCDAEDPCSIDVTDPFLGKHGSASNVTPSPTNTAVIPVSFAASDAGCPRAEFTDTESEFGIDGLLAATASASCSGSHPQLTTNTDIDGPAAVDSFVQGVGQDLSPLSFTDSPDSPDEQAALKPIAGKYALIPIGLSANVISFEAIAQGQQGFPDPDFDLTPNMAAGAITDYYSVSYNADKAKCKWLPKASQDCALMPMSTGT